LEAEEIRKRIEETFPGKVSSTDSEAGDPSIEVDAERLVDLLTFLKSDQDLNFDSLMCLSGVDYGAESALGVTYHIYSTAGSHRLVIKVKVPREEPVVPSVCSLWRTADWHEREAYDLFGIRFDGHPDLTRILLPEDWEGHPLRKDYVVNKTYRGIRFKD